MSIADEVLSRLPEPFLSECGKRLANDLRQEYGLEISKLSSAQINKLISTIMVYRSEFEAALRVRAGL